MTAGSRALAQADLFGGTGDSRAPLGRAAPRHASDPEAAARLLDAHEDYRVLRRVRPRPIAGRRPLREGEQLLIVLDTETTGLDCRRHEVIELGMVAVVHDAEGAVVEAFVAGAHRVCCHNAGFDRGFAEALAPGLMHLPWACSLREVDWAAVGTVGTKLAHILDRFGLFHDAHRAVHDCHALVEALARPHPAGGTVLRQMIEASDRTTARIFATHAPFERKDDLRRRGYHWGDGTDGRPRAWWAEVGEALLDDELAFLRREIYGWDAEPIVQRLTARERYRPR